MITFEVRLSTGHKYKITANPNTPLKLSINELFKKEKIFYKINYALFEGSKIYLDKSIIENQLNNDSILVLMVTDKETPLEKSITIDDRKNFEKCFRFLIYVCKIPITFFDSRGNSLGEDWLAGRKNGPPECLKEYYPPLGWIGIGLKVFNLYDNQDNTWLGNSNKKGEWYIAYHGIKFIENINSILIKGFRRGNYQSCKNNKNINYLTNREYPSCGEGVYFIPNFSETLKYIKTFKYLDDFYRIILMCRINPYKVRIADIGNNLESWIVNGDSLNDINGKKRDDEVRVYRIFVKVDNH